MEISKHQPFYIFEILQLQQDEQEFGCEQLCMAPWMNLLWDIWGLPMENTVLVPSYLSSNQQHYIPLAR